MLCKKEKYDLIIKLLNEGCTYRETTKIALCSPNEVSRISKQSIANARILDRDERQICLF